MKINSRTVNTMQKTSKIARTVSSLVKEIAISKDQKQNIINQLKSYEVTEFR